MTTGQELADQGTADVLAADCAPHRDFAALVREAVDALADRYRWTADDVQEHIAEHHPDARPHSANVLPAVLRGLSVSGRIEAVGWDTSKRAARRCGSLRVWTVLP